MVTAICTRACGLGRCHKIWLLVVGHIRPVDLSHHIAKVLISSFTSFTPVAKIHGTPTHIAKKHRQLIQQIGHPKSCNTRTASGAVRREFRVSGDRWQKPLWFTITHILGISHSSNWGISYYILRLYNIYPPTPADRKGERVREERL